MTVFAILRVADDIAGSFTGYYRGGYTGLAEQYCSYASKLSI